MVAKLKYLIVRVKSAIVAVVAGFALVVQVNAAPMDTAFSFTGAFSYNNAPANGQFDLRFALFNAVSGGTATGAAIIAEQVQAANGEFTVLLDFEDPNLFAQALWVELGYRAASSTGVYTNVTPRTPLFPVAQAMYALKAAGVADGSIGGAQIKAGAINQSHLLDGSITSLKLADGAGSGVDADLLDGFNSTNFWQLGGNTGISTGLDFLGTRDNKPLDFRVNNVRGLRLEPNVSSSPNIIGGSPSNSVSGSMIGVVIGGGGTASEPNKVGANFSVISGGQLNSTADGAVAANVSGGRGNIIDRGATYSTISGGRNNQISSNTIYSAIGGGRQNTVLPGSQYSTISGGFANSNNATYGAISGGTLNIIQSNAFYSTIGGGVANQILNGSSYSGIVGGQANVIQSNVNHATIAGGNANFIQSGARYASISGGRLNVVLPGAQYSTISGGYANTNNATYSTISGGALNFVQSNAFYSTISGGGANLIRTYTDYAILNGGQGNIIGTNADYAMIGGGQSNLAEKTFSYSAGRRAKALHQGAYVWADSSNADFASIANNEFSVRASGGVRFETGGKGVSVDGTPLLGGVSAQLSLLNSQLAALSNQLQNASQQLAAMPGELAAVSNLPDDAALSQKGYAAFHSIASPPWANGTTFQQPPARYLHAAVWTGTEFVTWGGSVGVGLVSAAGGRYDPVTDRWVPLPGFNAPAPRSGHSMVWTGSEAIVWGGLSGSGFQNTGGRFNPMQDAWRVSTTIGAPVNRDNHVAIWTGTRMLIWGGRSGTGPVASGALYDPVANTWEVLNISNSPEARMNAGSVWTGSRLVVWGGTGVGGKINSGGQLVFNNGVPSFWSAINSTGAPAARSGHSMVWTGTKVVVWGGTGADGSLLADGGVYDPIANQWIPLSLTANSPSARSGQIGLWTGTEMLIAGGESAAGTSSTSYAFNPSTSVWRQLTGIGNSQPRTGSVAAWTGSEMLLFGGRNNGVAIGSLQRLNPQAPWYFYRKL